MGSFLMRSQRDEPLLVGDLHFSVYGLQGLTRPSDLFVVIETDSYGHYFRKAKTRLSGGSTSLEPRWVVNRIMLTPEKLFTCPMIHIHKQILQIKMTLSMI